MILNIFLEVLILVMAVREAVLAFRQRRTYRYLLLLFWVLLLLARHTGETSLYPVLAVALIGANVLRLRDQAQNSPWLNDPSGPDAAGSEAAPVPDRDADRP